MQACASISSNVVRGIAEELTRARARAMQGKGKLQLHLLPNNEGRKLFSGYGLHRPGLRPAHIKRRARLLP
jgi:hypothetical protein